MSRSSIGWVAALVLVAVLPASVCCGQIGGPTTPQRPQPPPRPAQPPPTFPWWELIPPMEEEQPEPPPEPLPDLFIQRVEFDAQQKDQGWVTVRNWGNAGARNTKLRIQLLDASPPKRPAEKVRDAVSAADADLGKLPTGESWKKYIDLSKLKTFSAIDPSGEDPAVRRRYRKIAQKLDPDRVDAKYRSVLNRRSLAALRKELEDYLASGPSGESAEARRQTSPTAVQRFLGQYQSGKGWMRYLYLSDLQRIFDTPLTERGDQDLQTVRSALGRLTAATADPQYKQFLGHEVFVTLREALEAVAAEPPATDPPDELVVSIEAFLDYVKSVRSGDSWKRYFDTQNLQRVAGTPANDRELADEALLRLQRKNADKVAEDPRYRVLAGRPEFVALRDALRRQIDEGDYVVHARPPIEFKPWEIRDPQTGDPIPADTELTLPDERKVKAADFYAELNRAEKQLNAIGYSLRGDEDDVTLKEPVPDARFQAQADALPGEQQAGAQPFKPVVADPPKTQPAAPTHPGPQPAQAGVLPGQRAEGAEG